MLININGVATNTTATASDVQAVTRIQDLYDVSIPNSLTQGQLLVYDTGINNWINSTEVVDLTLSNLLTSEDIQVNNLLTSNDITVTGQTRSHIFRADADMNNEFKFYTTWENYGTTDYDVTTTLTTFKDLGSNQLALHQWKTEAGNPWYRFVAVDTGGGDDGSHNTELLLWGDAPLIKGNGGNLKVDANHIHSNGRFTISSSEYEGYEGEIPISIYGNPSGGLFNALGVRTPASHAVMILQSTDTGNGDDGSHESSIRLYGSRQRIVSEGDSNLEIQANGSLRLFSDNEVKLVAGGSQQILLDGAITLESGDNIVFNAGNNFRLDNCNSIELNTNNNFTLNAGGPYNVYSGGSQLYMENGYGSNIRMSQQLEMVLREDYQSQSTGVFLNRWNNNGGGVLEDGSQIQLVFGAKSEDESVDNIMGAFIATYNDNGNGNRFSMSLNDTAGNEVNGVYVQEDRVTTTQPFAYPQFDQTAIDAMSPTDGWVLYNSTTHKLQVYAGGAWVDLH